jgi:hypothetical protein
VSVPSCSTRRSRSSPGSGPASRSRFGGSTSSSTKSRSYRRQCSVPGFRSGSEARTHSGDQRNARCAGTALASTTAKADRWRLRMCATFGGGRAIVPSTSSRRLAQVEGSRSRTRTDPGDRRRGRDVVGRMRPGGWTQDDARRSRARTHHTRLARRYATARGIALDPERIDAVNDEAPFRGATSTKFTTTATRRVELRLPHASDGACSRHRAAGC